MKSTMHINYTTASHTSASE